MSYDEVVRGKITLADGSKTKFMVLADGSWTQWGGTDKQLGDRVALVQAIAYAVEEHA